MTECNALAFFVFLNKPVGITSQQLLTRYKKNLPRKTKVGHHGTLDPFAEGLMLVAVGEACKFISYVDDSQKTYVATLKLGEKTDTGDVTGQVIAHDEASADTILSSEANEKIASVLQSFLGKSKQIPPMHSAIKINGKRLYELARQGLEVERQPRAIEIFALRLLPSIEATPKRELIFEVTCSRGTYIRVLAEEIAAKLGSVGHLTRLVRTKLSGFCLQANQEGQVVPIHDLLRHHARADLSLAQKEFLYQGKPIPWNLKTASPADGLVTLFAEDEFFGVGIVQNGWLKPKRLLRQTAEF